jgi:hypothetical protein
MFRYNSWALVSPLLIYYRQALVIVLHRKNIVHPLLPYLFRYLRLAPHRVYGYRPFPNVQQLRYRRDFIRLVLKLQQ